MTKSYKDRIVIDRVWCSAYKTHGGKGAKHKFGRLKREAKKHTQNCFRRQKIMLEIQDMVYYKQLNSK
jgi:hypothetical protein